MKNLIIWLVIAAVIIIITVIIVKEKKRKKNNTDAQAIKEKLIEAINVKETPKAAQTAENKQVLVNKIAHVSDRKPAIGTRLMVSPKVSVVYSKPEARRGNMLRAIRKDNFAGTFLSNEDNGFSKLIDERENVIFMLSKDLYYSYK